MPSTADGIIYPSNTDDVDVPGDMQAMANSIQTLHDSYGALTTFTPSFTAGISSYGTSPVREGWYTRLGDVVIFGFRVQLGTSPSGTASDLQFDLPVTAWAPSGTGLQIAIGSWSLRDQSAATHYGGTIGLYVNTGLTAGFNGAWNGTSPSVRATGTTPFTFADTDIITGTGQYRAA